MFLSKKYVHFQAATGEGSRLVHKGVCQVIKPHRGPFW